MSSLENLNEGSRKEANCLITGSSPLYYRHLLFVILGCLWQEAIKRKPKGSLPQASLGLFPLTQKLPWATIALSTYGMQDIPLYLSKYHHFHFTDK
jgi:hypothetical protein